MHCDPLSSAAPEARRAQETSELKELSRRRSTLSDVDWCHVGRMLHAHWDGLQLARPARDATSTTCRSPSITVGLEPKAKLNLRSWCRYSASAATSGPSRRPTRRCSKTSATTSGRFRLAETFDRLGLADSVAVIIAWASTAPNTAKTRNAMSPLASPNASETTANADTARKKTMDKKLLTADELAGYLAVPVNTVHQWRKTGKGFKIGKYACFRPDEVYAWIDGRGVA